MVRLYIRRTPTTTDNSRKVKQKKKGERRETSINESISRMYYILQFMHSVMLAIAWNTVFLFVYVGQEVQRVRHGV